MAWDAAERAHAGGFDLDRTGSEQGAALWKRFLPHCPYEDPAGLMLRKIDQPDARRLLVLHDDIEAVAGANVIDAAIAINTYTPSAAAPEFFGRAIYNDGRLEVIWLDRGWTADAAAT